MSHPFCRNSVIALLVLLFVSFSFHSGWASQIRLVWNPNTEPDLAGYKVYYGTASGNYANWVNVRNTTIYTLTGLMEGETYFIAVTAYDFWGNESGYSNEVSGVAQDYLGVLVTELYHDILGRNPEPGGVAWWTGMVEYTASLGVDVKDGFQTLAEIFFDSEEYRLKNKTAEAFVIDLYQAFLNRSPDDDGMSFWLDLLAQGLSRNMMLICFARSDECRMRMAGLLGGGSAGPEVTLVHDLYQGFFNRFPDGDGFNHWLELMRGAQCTGIEAVKELTFVIAYEFIESQEYLMRGRDHLGFVENLYHGIFRRGGWPSDVNYWAYLLNQGTHTREEMLQVFIDSPEFQSRVEEVIRAGCLI